MLQTLLRQASEQASRLDDLAASAGRFAQSVVIALIILLVTVLIARFVRSRINRVEYLGQRDPSASALLTNIVYAAILVVGVIVALQAGFRVQLTALITALGIGGLAFSLALQDVLRNFVAGIYILLEKPFTLGDRIELKGVQGDVLSVDLRITRLRADNGEEIIIPNGALMTEVVTNQSLQDYRKYSVSLKGTRDALVPQLGYLKGLIGSNNAITQRPAPEVLIESLDAETAVLRLRFTVGLDSPIVAELVRELEQALPDTEVTAQVEAT